MVTVGILMAGCGDKNVLSGFSDDGSKQAKLEEAQKSLDKGECQNAVALFSELQTGEPTDINLRMSLSAAYMCQAGFDVVSLVAISADFTSGTVSGNNLFQTILEKAVSSIKSTWPEDLDMSEGLLTDNPKASPPVAYQSNDDVAFNLAIVNMVKAILTVADILNYVNGIANCVAQAGSASFTNCQITLQNVQDIVSSLEDSNALLTTLGVSSGVADSVSTVLTDMNEASPSDDIACSDIQQYIEAQKVAEVGEVSCV